MLGGANSPERRRTAGAIFQVTVPATIIMSAWRGDARKTSAPKRAKSYRALAVAIISIAQQAKPNMAGQSEERRAQEKTLSTWVTSSCWRKSDSTSVRSDVIRGMLLLD